MSLIRKTRRKARPGRLKGKDLEALRIACYRRDNGKCKECGQITIPDGPTWKEDTYHMAHIKAKRNGGDSLENVRTECGKCHREYHAYGPSRTKPVPRKAA